MNEKTIEAMVREKEQEALRKNSSVMDKSDIKEDGKPSLEKKNNMLRNAEGDIKNIEVELKVSTSSEIEMGIVGQLKVLIEKIKSGQLDLSNAQNLLKNVNSLKGRVSRELNKTNSIIRTTKEMDSNIDKLNKLIRDKYYEELYNEGKDEDIEELQNLLRELEDKKNNMKKLKGYLLVEQKALRSISDNIKGLYIAIERKNPDVRKPLAVEKFLVSIIDGIISLVKKADNVTLPKDTKNSVLLHNKDKDGKKDIGNTNEGILKILVQDGEVDKVKRILGIDKLKQDLTRPVNVIREEKRNSIDREIDKTQQLEIAEKQGIIKADNIFMHGKNKLYPPRMEKDKEYTKNNKIERNIYDIEKK